MVQRAACSMWGWGREKDVAQRREGHGMREWGCGMREWGCGTRQGRNTREGCGTRE